MGLIKPIKKGIELPTLSNPAAADNIQNGYEAVDGSGNKITGTHIEDPGLDTSDADAVAADIVRDKTAYVNGQKITGKLYTPHIYTHMGTSVNLNWEADSDGIVCGTAVNSFGEATAADVAAGVTAMTDNGLITGEATLMPSFEVYKATGNWSNVFTLELPREPIFIGIRSTAKLSSASSQQTFVALWEKNSGGILTVSSSNYFYNTIDSGTQEKFNLYVNITYVDGILTITKPESSYSIAITAVYIIY